jgi:hypothetical protein
MNSPAFITIPSQIGGNVMRILGLPVDFVKFSIGSKRSPILAIAVLSVMAVLLAGSVYVAKRSSAHGITPAKKYPQGCCSNQPAIPRRMIGTYYTTEDGFQSTLILNNKGPNQIMVTPILHSRNGRTFTASHISVGGRSSSEVDLNLLASIAGPQFSSGSFEFTYEGRLLEMGGGLRIVNAEKSLIFDEQMLESGMKFPSPQLEAVYAIPFEDSQVSVIVTNTTLKPIIVGGDAIFAGVNGHHPIQGWLGPHETKMVNLPHGLVKKASAGAVSLNHNGDKGALLAKIHLWGADRGYSESVNFISPGGKTTERHGAGLRLGSVEDDPLRAVIAVRNIGESATTVTATVPYSKESGDTGTISLPQVSLKPGEIKLLNTSNPQLRRNDFATAGLEIKYTGAPGSVIASASSVSRSGNHVFALPMKDPRGGLSSSGGYPWFINESSSTVVFIKNTTDKPQNFILSVIYSGGSWGLIHPPIPAGQTIAVDVRKLRDSQQKGVGDSVIPPAAVSGHISWSVRGTAEKVLIGRAQTVDFAKGMAATYECQCPCVYTWTGNTRMSPENPILSLGEQITIVPEAEYADCFGANPFWFQVNPFDLTTSSSNPFVVGYSPFFTATANNVGSVTISAQWTDQIVTFFSCDPSMGTGCDCDAIFPTAFASTTVTVQGPEVTLPNNLVAVGKNFSVRVNIGVSPPSNQTPITLSLSALSGTGEARFKSNNLTTLNITQSSEIEIMGVTESSAANNMLLEARAGGAALAGRSFTVVEVTLSLRPSGQPSGQFSMDNAARDALEESLGSLDLGTRFSNGTGSNAWRTVVEIMGTVKPSDFNNIFISRGIIASRFYQGSTLILSEDNRPDNSLPEARDDDPQPNGKVYDADGPSIEFASTPLEGTIIRRRTNFNQFAVNRTGLPARLSADLNWYSRISIIFTAGSVQLSTAIPGDNTAAVGTTNLSWNLQ